MTEVLSRIKGKPGQLRNILYHTRRSRTCVVEIFPKPKGRRDSTKKPDHPTNNPSTIENRRTILMADICLLTTEPRGVHVLVSYLTSEHLDHLTGTRDTSMVVSFSERPNPLYLHEEKLDYPLNHPTSIPFYLQERDLLSRINKRTVSSLRVEVRYNLKRLRVDPTMTLSRPMERPDHRIDPEKHLHNGLGSIKTILCRKKERREPEHRTPGSLRHFLYLTKEDQVAVIIASSGTRDIHHRIIFDIIYYLLRVGPRYPF